MARHELLGKHTESMKKTKGAKKKRLTMNQSFEVTTYLECQRERIDEKMTLAEVVTEVENKFPDWPISKATIGATLRVRKIKTKMPPHPMKGVSRSGGNYYAGVRECKERITALEKAAGETSRLADTVSALVRAVEHLNTGAEKHMLALTEDKLRIDDLAKQVADLRKVLGVE